MGRQSCWKTPISRTRLNFMSSTVVIIVFIVAVEKFTFSLTCRECKSSLKEHDDDVRTITSFGHIISLFRPHERELQLQKSEEKHRESSEARSSSQLRCDSEHADECPGWNEIWRGQRRSDFVSGTNVKHDHVLGDSNAEQAGSRLQNDTLDESSPGLSEPSRANDESKDTGPRLDADPEEPLSTQKPDLQETTSSDRDGISLPATRPVNSVWFYTKVYKHPEAKLRVLTEDDGAPRIQSTAVLPSRTITIVTQTSPERLPALERLCMTWGGALCIAVHVRLESQFSQVYKQLREMHKRLEQDGQCWLDLQMVTEDGFKTDAEALEALYPVNALRNVALAMAITKLVFLLDADFHPSSRLHESLTEDEETYQDFLTKATLEKQLFVVAAFEAANPRGWPTSAAIPETMEGLKAGWEKDTISCFHCKQSPSGHIATNFTKFFDPMTESLYPISYRDGFEPYVIGARDLIPAYDARFRGYGENKVSHLYLCAARGMGFQVVPKAFVFELPHAPSKARQSYVGRNRDLDQRNRIIGLYTQFKAEVEREQMNEDPARFRQFLKNLKRLS